MTTYILKDTYEGLIKRELTQQILNIIKDTNKEFTKKEIIIVGKHFYGNNFKVDRKGHTVLRYLKTMKKYNLVEELSQGNGKPRLWRIKNISQDLNFNIILNSHISKLKTLGKNSTSFFSNSGVTIYGMFGLDLLLESINTSEELPKVGEEFSEIMYQFYTATQKLVKLQDKILSELSEIQIEKILKECKNIIDYSIFYIFYMSLLFDLINSFEVKEDYSVNFILFEKDIIPHKLKPNIEFYKIVKKMNNLGIYKKINENDLMKKLQNYQMNEKLCIELNILFNFYFENMLYKPYFNVICDLGSPNQVFTEIYKDYVKRKFFISEYANKLYPSNFRLKKHGNNYLKFLKDMNPDINWDEIKKDAEKQLNKKFDYLTKDFIKKFKK